MSAYQNDLPSREKDVAQEEISPLVAEFWQSRPLAFWRTAFKWVPRVASRCCSFSIYPDGKVLWALGYAQLAYLKGNRSLTITWHLSEKWPPQRIIELSEATHWDKPHENIEVTEAEREELRGRLMEYCKEKKHRVLAIR